MNFRQPGRHRGSLLLLGLVGWTGSVLAFDSYVINVPTNVMKGDPDVFFTVTPYSGATPDLTPHNVYIDLPAGVLESPLANPPGGVDWSSIVSWGLFANNAVSPGNTPITVTQALAASPVTTTKFFNLQNVVRSFEIVPPAAFTGTTGVPFSITIRAKDGLGGGGALVSGFNDSVIVTASTGDVVVGGVGNIVDGSAFIGGEATVSVMLRGTDPTSRTNRITVTATVNYFSLGLASGYTDVNMDPGAYDHVVLLFPGETLKPGLILSPNGKSGAATAVTANVAVPNVIAYLVDQFNNPIVTPPAPVTLAFESLSYPAAPRPPNDTVPGLKVINVGNNAVVNGEFIFYRAPEVHQVRMYDFDSPGKNSVVSVLVNSGAPNLIEVAAVASPQYPGLSFTVSARVVDGTPAANTVTTYPNGNAVTLSLTNCAGSSFSLGTLDANPVTAGIQTTVHFANGVFTGPILVYPRVGTACVKFNDGLGNFGESGSFQILSGDELSLMVVLPDQTFTPGQSPGVSPAVSATRAVGTSVTAQVYVVDQGWNVIDNVSGGWTPGPVTLSLESNLGAPGYVDLSGTPAMPASGAFASIPALLLRTAYPAGDGRLVARMSGLEGRSVPLTINPDVYNKIVFVAPGETLASGIQASVEPDGKLGLPTSQVVNIQFPVSVYLTDAFFNPIINAPLAGGLWPTLTFSTAAPVGAVVTFPFANPFSMTDSSFDNLVGLGTLGANVLRVVDNSPAPKSVNQTIDVTPGDVTRFLVTPNSGSSSADAIPDKTVGVPFNLTFKAFDASDNRATNFSGPVQLELWEGGAPVPYAGTISPTTVNFVAHPVTGGQVIDQPVTITYAGPSLSPGPDGLRVRAFVNAPTMREGFSASFSMIESSTWSDIVLTRTGETLRPGLGSPFKTGAPTPVLAGNSFPVTVTAVDVYGNRVDRAGTADLSVLTAGVFANLGSPAQVTFLNGEGIGTVQVYTAGSSVLLATVTANGFNDRSTGTVTAGTYSAGTGRLALLAPGETLLPGSPSAPGKGGAVSSVEANTSMSYSLYACDRYYNRDATYSGNAFSLSSNDGAINLTNLSVNSGSATFSGVYLKGNLPNPSTVRVTATDQTDVLKTSYSDVPVTPGATYVVTVPSTATVGALFSMTVQLIDPTTGLPKVGANNAFTMQALTSSGAVAAVPIGVSGATLANGSVTFQQSYSYVETIKIRVTDSFNRSFDSGNITVNPNGLKYKVTLPAAPKTTDDTFSVTVGLYDSIQDALPIRSSSYQHSFSVSVEAGGLPAEGSAPLTTATLTNGEAVFNFSYTKAEHIVVRASGTVAEFSGITGIDDMDITPGAYVKVQLLAPGEVAVPGVPSLTGKDSTGLLPQAAREGFSLTVNAVDRYWNVVTSVNTPASPKVKLSSSDGSLASLPLQSFANGQAFFSGVTLATPPQVTITAEDTLSTSLFPQSVVISVTGRTYVADVTPNFPPNYYSGPPRDFHVDLSLYRYSGSSTGALVTGYSGNVFITPLTPSLQPLSPIQLVIVSPSIPDASQPNMVHMDPSGLLNLTLAYRVAEDVVLKFTDADGWQGFSAPIHFIPRDVDYAATTPVESRVGPPDTFTMTITPRDADTGTTAKNWSSSVTVVAVSPSAQPITGTLQVTNLLLNGGASTFQQAFSQSGVFYFTVSDGVKTSSSAAMNFLPGPLASMTTDLPATLEAGSTQTVHLTLLDAYSNPIPNLTLTFGLTDESFGTLSTLSGVSNVAGQSATVFATNGQKSGTGILTGESGTVRLQQAFRLLGPPFTSLRVGGRGVEEGKGFAIKPDDPVYMDIRVETGTTLVSVSYSVNGGTLTTSGGPFTLLPSGLYTFGPLGGIGAPGRYTVDYYGETLSGLTHQETAKTSKTFFVSNPTTAEEGLVNYPNPFRAGQDLSFMEYYLASNAGVRLTIYDMMGQRVFERRYSQGEDGGKAGFNRISWDGRNDDGVVVGNGGYVALLEISGASALKRKIAVKK